VFIVQLEAEVRLVVGLSYYFSYEVFIIYQCLRDSHRGSLPATVVYVYAYVLLFGLWSFIDLCILLRCFSLSVSVERLAAKLPLRISVRDNYNLKSSTNAGA